MPHAPCPITNLPMKVVVALEARFLRTPDGQVWTQTMFPYQFWLRYLEVFDRVHVVARTLPVDKVDPGWKRVDGEGVTCAKIPYYVGPMQYFKKAAQVTKATREAVGDKDAIIFRVGSNLANSIEPILRRNQRPYAVEVVADPYDVFAPGSVKHPLSPFFRWYFPRKMRSQCARATAASYVTKEALQRRYPPSQEAFATYYSDVELPETAFVDKPRSPGRDRQEFNLIYVGTMAQLYKAPDILIQAVAACVESGLNLNLVAIGDGKHRSELEALAMSLRIGDRVKFLGQLPAGAVVREQLDRADLFVLPSYQEGMPRAMLEAMARGLPCLGSTVGGFPELLAPEYLVTPGDVTGLAQKIRQVVTNPESLAKMSSENLKTAQDYTEVVLRQRWNEFYLQVRQRTQAWLDRDRESSK
jgi:glycosyltransferase involved in cell wall biosynthesis